MFVVVFAVWNSVCDPNAIAVCKSARKLLPSAIAVRSTIGVMTLDAPNLDPKPLTDGNKLRICASRSLLVTCAISGSNALAIKTLHYGCCEMKIKYLATSVPLVELVMVKSGVFKLAPWASTEFTR